MTAKPFDAHAWLFDGNRPLLQEPVLPYSGREHVEIGECYADGTIRTSTQGGPLTKGQIRVTEAQAQRAAYYGWKLAGLTQTFDDGRILVIVYR